MAVEDVEFEISKPCTIYLSPQTLQEEEALQSAYVYARLVRSVLSALGMKELLIRLAIEQKVLLPYPMGGLVLREDKRTMGVWLDIYRASPEEIERSKRKPM